jgi:arginyl-tRNA synthetase
VLAQWGGNSLALVDADVTALVSEHEAALLARLLEYPDALENAARELAPHLVAFYLRELAAEFHSYYNATRLLVEDENVKRARLALAASVRQVLRNGLALLGVSAPDSM